MNRNKILPAEILIPEIEKYKPIAERMFNYLNGNINPYNPCILYFSMFDQSNFAEFRKPNSVTIFLGSIICGFYERDLDIKSLILMCLAHELSHAWQNTDMIRYTNDPYYRQMVEDTNEGHTERWMIDHMEEIHRLFGFRLTYNNYSMTTILPKADDYEQASARDYYLSVIMDIVYRNAAYKEPLEKLFDSNHTIVFSINNSNSIIIKYRGKWKSKSIPGFANIIREYCRNGMAVNYFNVALKCENVVLNKQYRNGRPDGPDTNGIWINLCIQNITYCPIIGIEKPPEIKSLNQQV